MKSFLSLLLGIAIGFASAVLVLSPAAGPPQIHKGYHSDGSLAVEYTMDSQGRMHGTVIEYHPSGRVRSEYTMVHGQFGRAISEDKELDPPAVPSED